jgi:hypothetical protein
MYVIDKLRLGSVEFLLPIAGLIWLVKFVSHRFEGVAAMAWYVFGGFVFIGWLRTGTWDALQLLMMLGVLALVIEFIRT